MHPDSDALLDAIFDAPDDDTPRLVYADWLQEHGQEAYAKFIRLQCAVAYEKLWSDEANRLWEQIGRVWTRLDEEWQPATRDDWDFPGEANLDAVHFDRGLLRETCGLTGDQLVRYGNSCWPWLPLPELVLRSDPDDDDDGGEPYFPRLSRVRRIRATGVGRWRQINCWRFICSPQLSNLELLDLSTVNLPSSLAEQMLAPDRFRRLREVQLGVFDANQHQAPAAGCLTADIDASSVRLARLRRRLEARFEKVIWLGNS